jgi:pimeloyl-ACP methyl ester carboxylesterase
MAEDVEAFMAEKKIKQPVLIGHSMFVAVLESNT